MRTHTETFKETLTMMGRQYDVKITYTIDNEEILLTNEELNFVEPVVQGDILKSSMKELKVDSNVDIPIDTVINLKIGLLDYDNEEYEYLDYGNYYVISSELQEDTHSYLLTCYDKMIFAMKDYEEVALIYPTTVRDYITELCSNIGITFANENDTFANYDQEIPSDLYKDQGYTYRDVLDELAQVTASTICINDDDELEIRYINNAGILPKEYQQVEYIETDGNQWLELNYKSNSTTRVVADFDSNSIWKWVYGARYGGGSSDSFCLYVNNATSYWAQIGGNQASKQFTVPDATLRNVVDVDGTTFKWNGTTYGTYTNTLTNGSNNFLIFTITGDSRRFIGKMYYVKIYESNTIKVNLIPCYRKSDNVIGMYDLVNNVFYTNAGTGTFTKGEDIVDTIDEEYFDEDDVVFNQKFGPINSVVLSRAAGSDNVFLRDEESIAENGLCELKIKDNQIMNFNNRSDFLPDILEKLDGLEYYPMDVKSKGVLYYEICDRYKVTIGENEYTCILFNDEITVEQAIEEHIYVDIPEKAETDYKKADKTDRRINQTTLIVDKQQGEIEALASRVDTNEENIGELTITSDNIQTNVSSMNENLTNQISTLQSSTSLQINAINQTLENGVEKLTNSLVTIDTNGINTSRSDETFNTQITNKTFEVRDGDNEISFMGYDSTLNKTVARINELEARQITAGVHRTEIIEEDNELWTADYYVGDGS